MQRKKVTIDGQEWKLTAFTRAGFEQEGGPLSSKVYKHEALVEVRIGDVLQTRVGVYRRDGERLERVATKSHEKFPAEGAEELAGDVKDMIDAESARWTDLYELVQAGKIQASDLAKAQRARRDFAVIGILGHGQYDTFRKAIMKNDEALDAMVASLGR